MRARLNYSSELRNMILRGSLSVYIDADTKERWEWYIGRIDVVLYLPEVGSFRIETYQSFENKERKLLSSVTGRFSEIRDLYTPLEAAYIQSLRRLGELGRENIFTKQTTKQAEIRDAN